MVTLRYGVREFDSMRALRQYFRNEKEVDRENIYISSYWKQGVSEDGHKVIKREDAESNNSGSCLFDSSSHPNKNTRHHRAFSSSCLT